MKFSAPVNVEQWRAAPSNVEQQRVDEVVRLVKAGAIPFPSSPLGGLGRQIERPSAVTQVSEDLENASELLEKLGDALASDPDLVARHGIALQNLDIAAQVIASVRSTVGGATVNIDATKAAALRRSVDQALQRTA